MSNSFTYQFQQINELLRGARKILVASHEMPDPDAVGSLLALHQFFKKQGLESFPYLPDSPPKNLNFLPAFFEIETKIPPALNPDLLFCLDYGDFDRLKLPDNLAEKPIITIDHHIESDQRGQIKIIEPRFSSTSEIIYCWLHNSGIEFNKDIAICLLTGIISDSGGFCHVSTSSQTLKIVADLLLKGVSLGKIARQISVLDLNPLPASAISKIWGKALSRIKLDKESALAYSWLTFEELKKYGAQPSDLAGIPSFISTVSPTNFGLFLVEYEEGKIKGSLRADPYQGKNVVSVARALGGGGHPYAAGFRQEGTIEEVLKKVLDLIKLNKVAYPRS